MEQNKVTCLNIIKTIFRSITILCLKDFVGMFPKAAFVMFLHVEEEINKGPTILQTALGSMACVRLSLHLSQTAILPNTALMTTIHHHYVS